MISRIIITTLALVALNVSHAHTKASCTGMSSVSYKEFHVYIDLDNEKIIVNGGIFKIKSYDKTKRMVSIIGEKFVSEHGTYVFNTINLFTDKDKDVYLAQYNAVTGKMVEAIELICNKK